MLQNSSARSRYAAKSSEPTPYIMYVYYWQSKDIVQCTMHGDMVNAYAHKYTSPCSDLDHDSLICNGWDHNNYHMAQAKT